MLTIEHFDKSINLIGVSKTRHCKGNGKRDGMENGMKRKAKQKFRRKKHMNFVDATAYKGNRFKIKQNFDF